MGYIKGIIKALCLLLTPLRKLAEKSLRKLFRGLLRTIQVNYCIVITNYKSTYSSWEFGIYVVAVLYNTHLLCLYSYMYNTILCTVNRNQQPRQKRQPSINLLLFLKVMTRSFRGKGGKKERKKRRRKKEQLYSYLRRIPLPFPPPPPQSIPLSHFFAHIFICM